MKTKLTLLLLCFCSSVFFTSCSGDSSEDDPGNTLYFKDSINFHGFSGLSERHRVSSNVTCLLEGKHLDNTLYIKLCFYEVPSRLEEFVIDRIENPENYTNYTNLTGPIELPEGYDEPLERFLVRKNSFVSSPKKIGYTRHGVLKDVDGYNLFEFPITPEFEIHDDHEGYGVYHREQLQIRMSYEIFKQIKGFDTFIKSID